MKFNIDSVFTISELRIPKYVEYAAVLLTILLGIVLRTAGLDLFPFGLAGDEAWSGLEAQRILQQGGIGAWSPTALGQPSGYFYWVALFFTFLPNDIGSLRLTFALIGIITLVLCYLFTRSFFGRFVAIVSLFLLCVSPWHILISRSALSYLFPPLFISASLMFMNRGLKSNNLLYLCFAGIAFGLGFHTYLGYFASTYIFVLLWIVLIVKFRKNYDKILIDATVFWSFAILASLPVLIFIYNHTGDIIWRSNFSSVFALAEYKNLNDSSSKILFFATQIYKSIASFFVTYNGVFSRTGILGLSTKIFLLIGIIISFIRYKDWHYNVLLIGFIIAILQIALTTNTGALFPHVEKQAGTRGVIALPMIYALAGIGFAFTLQKLSRLFPLTLVWIPRVFMCIVLILYGAYYLNKSYKFSAQSDSVKWFYEPSIRLTSEYLDELRKSEGDIYVYFYSDRWFWNYEPIRFLAPDLKGENRSRKFGEFSIELNPAHSKVVYLLMPPYDKYLEQLKSKYPGGQQYQINYDNQLMFKGYYLGANNLK